MVRLRSTNRIIFLSVYFRALLFYTRLTALNVRDLTLLRDYNTDVSLAAHTDAVWGIACASDADRTVSISADGSIKAWDSASGQVSRIQPPHTLGLVSLSLSRDGKHALYNSIEGLTTLWNLDSGDVVGKFESYARTTGISAGEASAEPCM